MLRWSVLVVLVLVAIAAIAFTMRQNQAARPASFEWVATAHQFGPVGYRDPIGAISPDGRWLAYSEGRFLRVMPVAGGPIVDFPPGDGQIRHVAWQADSRSILANGYKSDSPWAVYDRASATVHPLWAGRDRITAPDASARIADLRQPVWAPDGRSLAAMVSGRDGPELWVVSADGAKAQVERMAHATSWPAWTSRGEVACITTIDGRSRLTLPCGREVVRTEPDLDVYGPIALSSDGSMMYGALANAHGNVDLWRIPSRGGRAAELTTFSRDTYAPSVAADGGVLFKVQTYRTTVAVAATDGGAAQPVAAFQSETPSWDPTGDWLGITYGTWRRVIDDAKYPDIAQEAGIIAAEGLAERPARVVHASISEDQSLCWSPNRKWIAFHSHKDASDDIWLRSANGNEEPQRISFVGRGAETGWPRWSPDGRLVLFESASRTTHRHVLLVVGVDQETATITQPEREIEVRGVGGDASHAEWLPDGGIVAINKEAAGRHVIYTVPREGGDAHVIARIASEHDNPGLAVSPEGREVAFIAPAADGYFQVFRQPLAGGDRIQVTRDPSNKTQPAWSPDGRRLAMTVWEYEAQFWIAR